MNEIETHSSPTVSWNKASSYWLPVKKYYNRQRDGNRYTNFRFGRYFIVGMAADTSRCRSLFCFTSRVYTEIMINTDISNKTTVQIDLYRY